MKTDRKQEEKAILKKVYSLKHFNCIEAEQPDFIFHKHSDNSKCFGIEITNLYLSEGWARLSNIPNYIENVLEGENLDKRDEGFFSVREIELTSPEGDKQQQKGIIDNSPLTLLIKNIEECIKKKSEKQKSYNSDCMYHNLLIYDQTDYLHKTENTVLLTDSLIREAFNSGFCEIFLITTRKDKEIFIPLKQNIFNFWLSLGKSYHTVSKKFRDYFTKNSIVIFMYELLRFYKENSAVLYLHNEKNLVLKFSKYLFFVKNKKLVFQVLAELDDPVENKIEHEEELMDDQINKFINYPHTKIDLIFSSFFSTDDHKITI